MDNVNGVKIVCSECGSDDILLKMWFNPNNGEPQGWDEDEECYCNKCQKKTFWEESKKIK